ncbi:MAG: hypothetical protein DWQ10_12155 [Calditrichaeota bacterium]|nr:MAG: hypothetical protein DWQ10_12155 [Calditrichota bacterium]
MTGYEIFQKKGSLFVLLFTVLLFCTASLAAQTSVKANLSAAYFQNQEKGYFLEVYYSIADAVFAAVHEQSDLDHAEIVFNLVIKHEDDVWATKVWKVAKSADDTTLATSQQSVVDGLRYAVDKPGVYEIKLYTNAVGVSKMLDSTSVSLSIKDKDSTEIELSDVLFSSKIGRANDKSKPAFVRNGYEIVPNPASLFGESSPIIYYYFEAYNLSQKLQGDKYKLFCTIESKSGIAVKGTGSAYRTKKKTGDTAIEMGTKIISKLPSGTYSFVYGIADIDEQILVKKRKDVFIYNPAIPHAKPTGLSITDAGDKSFIELYRMGNAELDLEFVKMIYLVDKPEREFFKKLTNEKAKADYIKDVWVQAAAKQSLVGSVYRYIYLKRIDEANVKFKSVFADGWKSDRGRVYVLYGPPYEVQRFPNSPQTIPYEVWAYGSIKGQGNVVFIFSDKTGFKKYEQIHSTLIGELQEPDWQRMVSKGTQSDYTSNPFDN